LRSPLAFRPFFRRKPAPGFLSHSASASLFDTREPVGLRAIDPVAMLNFRQTLKLQLDFKI
jgi:hypothetical protein